MFHLLSRTARQVAGEGGGGVGKLAGRQQRPPVNCRSLFTCSTYCTAVSSAAVNDLKKIVGTNNVSTNRDILLRHGKDEGHFESMPPEAVVFAQKTEDVISLTEYCNEHTIPIIPYGAGSGLEGGVNAVHGGISLDMSQMNKIICVNENDFDCIVQPGVNWRQLNEYLRDTGLWFPVDPGASASLGGMASTCASGTNAVRYGTMKQNVLNVEVVLPNACIIHTSGIGFRSKKTSAGYNLTELFVGSEGTLGTFTQLTLKLRASPSIIAAAICSFPSVKAAVDTAIEILQNDIPVARMEFMDQLSMQATQKYSHINLPSTNPSLLLEFHGSNQHTVNIDADSVKQIAISNGSSPDSFQFTADHEERNKLWKARHELFMACKNLLPNSQGWVTDVCVPISQLTQMVIGAQQLFNQYNLIGESRETRQVSPLLICFYFFAFSLSLYLFSSSLRFTLSSIAFSPHP